jgi:hypothetical protein
VSDRTINRHRTVSPDTVEKRIRKDGKARRLPDPAKSRLEWYDPLVGGLEAVGGLDVLKGWLASRKLAYSKQAREYGVKAPACPRSPKAAPHLHPLG